MTSSRDASRDAPLECAICLSTITEHNRIINPCCKNSFCTTCIYTNISKGNTSCPLCRFEHINYRTTSGQLNEGINDSDDSDDSDDSINVNDYIIGLENKIHGLTIKYNAANDQKLYYKCILLCNELLYPDEDGNYSNEEDGDNEDDVFDVNSID